MITASFRHIRGIGPLRERQLWLAGVRGWDQVPDGIVLAASLDEKLRRGVAESRARLDAGDFAHFAQALPPVEHWRLLPQLLEGAGCLDVEVGATPGEVTVVGVLDKDGPHAFLRGRDLHEFPARAAAWSCLITFNGLAFDLPVLRRAFPEWRPPAAHVDLRHLLARSGQRGTLKQIEARLGLFRPPHLRPLSGADAVWLWQAQQRGDRAALRRLVEYNLYDTFHLRPLAELGYNAVVRRTGMPANDLPSTDRGALVYDVSRAVERATH
ncbi:MAG: ribonuclease H-like domain-containing protein [Myxococcales bacterium]